MPSPLAHADDMTAHEPTARHGSYTSHGTIASRPVPGEDCCVVRRAPTAGTAVAPFVSRDTAALRPSLGCDSRRRGRHPSPTPHPPHLRRADSQAVLSY